MNNKSSKKEETLKIRDEKVRDTLNDLHSFLFCTKYELQDCIDAALRGSKADMEFVVNELSYIKKLCNERQIKVRNLTNEL